jgi:hypothetical protein
MIEGLAVLELGGLIALGLLLFNFLGMVEIDLRLRRIEKKLKVLVPDHPPPKPLAGYAEPLVAAVAVAVVTLVIAAAIAIVSDELGGLRVSGP